MSANVHPTDTASIQSSFLALSFASRAATTSILGMADAFVDMSVPFLPDWKQRAFHAWRGIGCTAQYAYKRAKSGASPRLARRLVTRW